ncbi:hypothetical protein K438DRAFT_1776683 [Mycena galopus ATCC 62051]|nr:hypothetical protein K438DRAFT_1776683 [Mycena galopus ATCC 62051]
MQSGRKVVYPSEQRKEILRVGGDEEGQTPDERVSEASRHGSIDWFDNDMRRGRNGCRGKRKTKRPGGVCTSEEEGEGERQQVDRFPEKLRAAGALEYEYEARAVGHLTLGARGRRSAFETKRRAHHVYPPSLLHHSLVALRSARPSLHQYPDN